MRTREAQGTMGAPVNTNDEAGTEGEAPILGVQFSAPAILGLFTSGMTEGSTAPLLLSCRTAPKGISKVTLRQAQVHRC